MAQSEKLQANSALFAGETAGRLCRLALGLVRLDAQPHEMRPAGPQAGSPTPQNLKQATAVKQPAWHCWRIDLANSACYLTKEGRFNSQREKERQRLSDNFHLVLFVCLVLAVSFSINKWRRGGEARFYYTVVFFSAFISGPAN